MFNLHPQLAQDCYTLGHWPLCQLLLLNDSHYPWYILVPRQPEIREIYQLNAEQQQQLWQESAYLSQQLMQIYQGDKLNVAALGNMVPQLHLHHIVRFTQDAAWPQPVWGRHPAQPYTHLPQAHHDLIATLNDAPWTFEPSTVQL